MANALEREGFLQESMECPVCYMTYDSDERCPIALRCQHTSCSKCIGSIISETVVRCPLCKQPTEKADARKNFALSAVLGKLCEECVSQERAEKCHHCDKDLCKVCIVPHATKFHQTVKAELTELQTELRSAVDISMNDLILQNERRKGDLTLEEISMSIKNHLDQARKLQRELNNRLKELVNKNVATRMQWRKTLDAKIDKCRPFVQQSADKLATKFTRTGDLSIIRKRIAKFSTDLKQSRDNVPQLTEYKYVPPVPSDVNMGKIITPSSVSEKKPPLSAVRYKQAVFQAMTASGGSDLEDVGEIGCVACMDDKFIITDTANSRIKVYDRNLYLIKVFGEEGQMDTQFDAPTSVCIGPGNMIYISDTGNDRIKVYDEDFQFVWTFGSTGSDDDEFDNPEGLAFMNGELLVCDKSNHRIKVVEPDGTFLRSIGTEGEGPGQFSDGPSSVAIAHDGTLLIAEQGDTIIHIFKIDGQFIRRFDPKLPDSEAAIPIWNITCDQSGNIIITDLIHGVLIVLDPDGEFVCTIGSNKKQPGQLNCPSYSAVNSEGDICVFDGGNNRIQLFELH